jgi:hypothetical protein
MSLAQSAAGKTEGQQPRPASKDGNSDLMRRNIARAYNALMAEHHKVRAAHMKILAQGDAMLERKLLRANEDDEAHIEEVLIYEERLSVSQRRKVYKLSSYGRKIEKLVDALLKL